MRILALETTERLATVAALVDEAVLSSVKLPPQMRTAQSLAPSMKELLQAVGWSSGEVELVAVSNGPGSFTGLRVGVTTAKTFAYAVKAEVLAVNTLEVIAYQAPEHVASLQVVLDAQSQQVFCGSLVRDEAGNFVWKEATKIIGDQQWLASLKSGDVVTGPALTKLATKLPEAAEALPEQYWAPTAEAVGQLAWRRYSQGQRNDLWGLVPQYFRQSAAEEKLEG
jgi:tRNA threonylcarbamoyladenosine biosynthesis protein TsaB